MAGRPIDEAKVRAARRLLRERAHTPDELARKLRTSKRTVWRWLKLLGAEGGKLVRLGTGSPVRYQIL